METVINSEAFLIVISGVLIFTIQNIILRLWIAPIVAFKKCLAKIEALLGRYASLYGFEHRNNQFKGMDAEIEFFRKELKNLTSEMLCTYSALPQLERRWFIWRHKIDVRKAQTEMLTLSAVFGTRTDQSKEKSRAEIAIENIPRYLNFPPIKYKLKDVLN